MKKIYTFILIGLMICKPSISKAQCEMPMDFMTAFTKIGIDATTYFAKTTVKISNNLMLLIKAIDDETNALLQSITAFDLQMTSLEDAVKDRDIVVNNKVANLRNQLNNRSPDFGNSSCQKATGSKNVIRTKKTTDKYKELHQGGLAKSMNKKESTISAATKRMDNRLLAYSDLEHEVDPTKPSNPFLNADINTNSLFGVSTFKNLDSYTGIPSSDALPNTLIAAQAFTTNLVSNKGVDKPKDLGDLSTANKEASINAIRTMARKSLAFSPFSELLSERTTIPGSGTGIWLRNKYSEMAIDGSEVSAKAAGTIADDISEYELREHLYSKMYQNPDWATSLETPNKQLQIEEIDVINKNMALEWQIYQTLEKIAVIDGVNLATTIDNASK